MLYPVWTRRAVALGVTMATAVTMTAMAGTDLPKISYEKFELSNGLTVVLSVDKSAPVIASFVLYHVGSKNERPDRTGFAHFFEHLMFEGTDNIPRHTLDKLIQSAGGNLNAYTTFDETGYQIQLPSNELELALWIESERMLHARIEEIGVETQRGVVKEERNVRIDNQPYGSAFEYIASAVGKGTPYEWTPIGSAQYIDQATIDEFRDFYKKYYIPNNAVLTIVGDIDIAKTKQLIQSYFGDIPRGEEFDRPSFDYAVMGSEVRKDIVESQTPLPALIYAYRTAPNGHPDSYALEYLTNILANGSSSRLYKIMVDEKRLAVASQAFPIGLEKGGMFGMFTVAPPSTTMQQLETELDAIIEEVKKNGVTEEEYQKARNQIETQYAGSFNNVLQKAQALATYQMYFGDPGLINDEINLYMKVTRDDIKRVANKYLVTTNRAVLKYLPPTQE